MRDVWLAWLMRKGELAGSFGVGGCGKGARAGVHA